MILEALTILGTFLTWDPPDGAIPDGYIVYAGSTSGAYEAAIDVGREEVFELTGYLTEGRLFFLAVTAYNIGGESVFSNEITAFLISSVDEIVISRVGMYPNPFSNSLTIEAEMDCTLEVFNVLGQKLRTLFIRRGQTEIMDTKYFPSGAYFFRFQVIGSNEWLIMKGLKR